MQSYHTKNAFIVKKGKSQGFALIATISVMTLLVMMALAMLSLSTIEVRHTSQTISQEQAKANARMALMLAIGELQKYAGPDQRVTANANIHRAASSDKSHIMGVWSTENWDPTKPDDKKFLSWLATIPLSDTKNPELKDVETPYSLNDSLVFMVGEGSLGKNSDPKNHVKVSTIPVINNQGETSGSYGYWVSDEASKATYAVPVEKKPLEWNKMTALGVPRRTGLEVLDPMLFADYEELVKSSAGHIPSYQSIDNIHPNTGKHSQKTSQRYFHHLTNRSISLLTDTRRGGIKADLSTAFELDLEEFNAVEEFHNSKELNATNNYDALNAAQYNQPDFYPSSHKLGYLFEVPTARGIMRGPTWDLLRNHYRLYKRDWEKLDWARKFDTSPDAIAARGALPLSYSAAYGKTYSESPGIFVQHSNLGALSGNGNRKWGEKVHVDEPLTHGTFEPSSGVTRSTAARVSPLVIRFTMVVGVRKIDDGSGDWRLAFSLDPYLTLVNPYNRAIEFESIGIYTSKYHPFKFDITYTNQANQLKHLEHMAFFGNWYNNGAMILRLPVGQHRLEPGEVRVMCPEPSGLPKKWSNSGVGNIAKATFNYNDNSGIYLFPAKANKPAPKIKPKSGTPVKIIVTGRYGSSEDDTIFVTQHYSKDHRGGARDLLTHIPPKATSTKFDVFDDPLICRLGYSTYSPFGLYGHPLKIETKFNLASVPDVGDPGFSIAALDVRMQHGMEQAPVFHQFSPRGQIFDTLNYDGSDRMTPAWKIELKEISDVSELSLVGADLEAYWGDGNEAGTGSPRVVLYDLPRSPITSIASLSQADIASLPEGGSYHIGNSFPHPGLKDLKKISGQMPVNTTYAKNGGRFHADFSWAANEAIWDQYFFSSINWGDSNSTYGQSGEQIYLDQYEAIKAIAERNPENPFANPRIIYTPGKNAASELNKYNTIANHLSLIGGFNVNSTSVEAWRAVLSALKGEEVNYLGNGNKIKTSQSNIPYSRMILPAGDHNDLWSGFRSLSDDDVEKLAEGIVTQVKTRGPFMGLADFINRRLTTDVKSGPSSGKSEIGKLGALQMAIESAGLNDGLGRNISTANMFNKTIKIDGHTVKLSTMTGAPGYLMQSDILTSIGSILRTRSDTFVIRAYGDTKDRHGKIIARAWCEATLQRSAEWFEDTDEPFKIQSPEYPNTNTQTIIQRWVKNPDFPDINKRYGRKLKVVSFRWLNQEEI